MSLYDFTFFIKNLINTTIINVSSNEINITPTEENNSIQFDNVKLSIGIYILKINIQTKNNYTTPIAKLKFNNNIYELTQGDNEIDICIINNVIIKPVIIDFLLQEEYIISNIELSTDINDILFEPSDQQSNKIENNESIKSSTRDNIIYPTQSIQKKMLKPTKSNKQRIIKYQYDRKPQRKPIINVPDNINENKEPLQQVIIKKKIHKSKNQLTKINIKQSHVKIDHIFILNNSINANALYKYYSYNCDCTIVNTPNINNNVTNKELAILINKWMYILNQSIINNYVNIMVLNDNIIPNINKNVFDNNSITNKEFMTIYDLHILSGDIQHVNACIINKSLFSKILKSISNYAFDINYHLENILSSHEFKYKIYTNYYVLNTDIDSLDSINYIYYIDGDNINNIEPSIQSLCDQTQNIFYLTIFKPSNINIPNYELPSQCYMTINNYTTETQYEILSKIYEHMPQKYICLISSNLIFDKSFISVYNKSISSNAPFINGGYINNNKITHGRLYTPETFLYSDLIQIFIIKREILQLCLGDSLFTMYKNIFSSNINKDIIYDPYVTKMDNCINYMSIQETPISLNVKISQESDKIMNVDTKILDEIKILFDMSKDTILCYYSNNSILNDRLYNICKGLTKYYNIIIFSDTYNIIDSIFILPETLPYKEIDFIKINKIIALFYDIDKLSQIQNNNIHIDDIIYDINSINAISKLNTNIINFSFITYSCRSFFDEIKNHINDNSNYYLKHNKQFPQILYLPNCIYSYDIENDITPNIFRNKDIKHVLYIGAVTKSLNFNIIKNIATNTQNIGISLTIINTKKITNGDKLMFQDDNITWLDISSNSNINNNIQRYIKYADIIIFPFYDTTNNKFKIPKEYYMACYYNKPIISTYDYIQLENYSTDSPIVIATNWIQDIIKIKQELNCNIRYEYHNYNNNLWVHYSEQLYRLIQNNETLFLSNITNSLIKSCAVITRMHDDNNIIYGFYQFLMLNIIDILLINGIQVSIYQISNDNINNSYTIEFNSKQYTIKDISQNDLYTLNNYDYIIYDSSAKDIIKNIIPNSIYINSENDIDILKHNNIFIDNTILTVTTNTTSNIIYSILNYPQDKLYYIPSFYYSRDDVINNQSDIIQINIPYYKLEYDDISTIKNILTQIRNKNIRFNIRITIQPMDNIIAELDKLVYQDNRFNYTLIDSFDKLLNYYTDNSITLFINQCKDLYLEYYTAIHNGSIILIVPNNISSDILNNFNGIILQSTSQSTIIKSISDVINTYNKTKILLYSGKEYITYNYTYHIWAKKITKLFMNIGWIYDKLKITTKNNYLIDIDKKNIDNQYIKLWKNYTYTFNLQNYYKPDEMIDAIKKHFDVNQFNNIEISSLQKKIMILGTSNKYSDISYLIHNICQYTYSDVYLFDKSPIQYNDFIYSTITDKSLPEISKNYDIILFFDLPDNILNILHSLNIITIQYIYNIESINKSYISYHFPSKIITHSPYIANYMAYKYNIIPTIIPLPVKYMIDVNNKENKEFNDKKIIACFTSLNKKDGVDVFIKMIKRYQSEYGILNDTFDLRIYYYNYDNNYLEELQNKVKLFDLYIDFIEIKKDIDYYIFNSDLIIIPILSNTIPIILLRAMLYNKSIIISSQFSIREFNTLININGYNDLLYIFKSNDVSNLKNCFINWLNDKKDTNKLCNEYVLSYYNQKLFINKLLSIIDILC